VSNVGLLKRFFTEDLATETTDYALVIGFIALGSATVVSAVSGSVNSWWGNISVSWTAIFGVP
jgi:Flp pilus assembly pilin Flp